MSDMRVLYDLQQLDLQIDARNATVQRVEDILRTDDTVQRAEATLQEQLLLAGSAHEELSGIEQRVEEIAHRSDSISNALYKGQIKNARELNQMQDEVASLKEDRSILEEQELEAMIDVEAADEALKDAKRALETAKKDWEERKAALAIERKQAETERSGFEERRAQLLASNPQLDKVLLDKYERLRRAKRGLAIAVVDSSACSGCRVQLPKATLQECRMSANPVTCGSCGRILYAGH
jgi:uncharacterized protein